MSYLASSYATVNHHLKEPIFTVVLNNLSVVAFYLTMPGNRANITRKTIQIHDWQHQQSSNTTLAHERIGPSS